MTIKNYENSLYLRRLVSEVSKHTQIRRDVVELVVRGVIDIIASDIANKGGARIPFVLTVKNYEHQGHKNGIGGTEIKPSDRLAVKISYGIRRLWKRHNEEGLEITPNNWRDYLYEETLKRQPKHEENISEDLRDDLKTDNDSKGRTRRSVSFFLDDE